MRYTTLLILLAFPAMAGEPPYYIRQMKDDKDLGAVNENFRSLSDLARDAQQSAARITANLDIAEYYILASSDSTKSYLLDVATDGALTAVSTTAAASGFKYLSYQTAAFDAQGMRLTVDVDGAIHMILTTLYLYAPYIHLTDSSGVVWRVALEDPGVLTTENIGSL